MKKNIIAANFKMNMSGKDIVGYFDIFLKKFNKFKETVKNEILEQSELVFAPSFTELCETYRMIEPYSAYMSLSAQNVNNEKSGAHTGEISLEMIKSCGCRFVIIGHSERRNIYREDDEFIAKKFNAVYKFGGIIPILCVGENKENREKDNQYAFVEKQLEIDLASLKQLSSSVLSLTIAYEPIWAIGTGLPINPEDGENMHKFIYDYIEANFKIEDLRIIYGGSVTESNIKELMGMPHINGVLVGGASLDPNSFFNIFNYNSL